MSELWSQEEFARELRERERVLVLFYASWCPFSRIFLPAFDQAEAEASVPFARANLQHPLDPRWDEYEVRTVPTLVYFEHGEPLERVESERHEGLTRDDLEELLETVDALQEDHTRQRHRHRRASARGRRA